MTEVIGRERELDALNKLAVQYECIHLHGVSGVGKTSLLKAWVKGLPVLWVSLWGVREHRSALAQVFQALDNGLSVGEKMETFAQGFVSQGYECVVLDHADDLDDPEAMVLLLQNLGIQVIWVTRECTSSNDNAATSFEVTGLTGEDANALVLSRDAIHAYHPPQLALDKLHLPRALMLFGTLMQFERVNYDSDLPKWEVLFERVWGHLSEVERDHFGWCVLFHEGLGEHTLTRLPDLKAEVLSRLCDLGLMHQDLLGHYSVEGQMRAMASSTSIISPSLQLAFAHHVLSHVEQAGVSQTRTYDELNVMKAIRIGQAHDVDVAIYGGRVLFKLKRYKGPFLPVLETIEQILDGVSPSHKSLEFADLLAMAAGLCCVTRRLVQAQGYVSKAMKIATQYPVSGVLAGVHHMSAMCASRLHQDEQAIWHAEQAQRISLEQGEMQRHIRALQMAGQVYYRAKRFEKSIACLQKVLEYEPENQVAWASLGSMYVYSGDAKSARACFETSLATEGEKYGKLSTPIWNNMTLIEIFEGDFEQAQVWASQVAEVCEAVDVVESVFFHEFYVGLYHQRRDELSLALERYQRALKSVRGKVADRIGALCVRGGALALLGKHKQAVRDLTHAKQLYDQGGGHRWSTEDIDYLQVVLFLCGVPGHQDMTLEQGRLFVEERAGDSLLVKVFKQDLEARFSHMWTEDEPKRVLELKESGKWLSIDQTKTYDLRRHHVTRRLLVGLVKAHEESPGVALSIDELFEAGWPGETFSLTTQPRFYTAMHRLRENFLGELLLTQEQGYLLDPACEIQWQG